MPKTGAKTGFLPLISLLHNTNVLVYLGLWAPPNTNLTSLKPLNRSIQQKSDVTMINANSGSGSGVGGGGEGEETTAASSIATASPIVARGTGNAVNKETTANNKPQQKQQQRQLCRFYFQNNNCRHGSSCRFSHDKPNDDMTREEILQTILCPHYSRGYCAFGDQCELLHHCPTTLQPLRQEQKHEQQEQQSQQNHHQHHQQQENNNDETLLIDTTCGICLENVYNTKQCKFGLLSCCDHVFCFSCLMQWRTRNTNSSSQGNSNNNNNNRNNRNDNNSEISSSTRRVCPTCRKSSNYVVPSSTFPTNSTEKTTIVTNYKTKCSRMTCKKYTVGKLGSCPFGCDCFYAHYDENGIDMKKDDMTMQELFEERERHRLRRRRDRNNRESDLDMIAEMLMMMALQRQFGGGRDGSGGGGGGRRGGGRRGERRSRGGEADDDNEDEDEDDEFGIDDFLLHLLSMAGDTDMPFPLQHLFGAMAASAFDGEEDDGSSPFNRNDDEDDESLDSMPPLEEIVEHQSDLAIALDEIGAEFQEEENNSDDDNSMPPLEDLDNDDDNSMPPLEDIE